MAFDSPPINRIKKPGRMHHDFETFSHVDVTKVGSSRYSMHPTTEVLMLGYAFDGGPVKQWVPPEGQLMPAEVEDAILDDTIKKFAWNKPFEWAIWRNVLDIETPHTAWRDPMVLALSCSLPGKLEKAGPVAGLGPEYLKKSGTRLINWFSKLRPATKTLPERRVHWWQKYDLWQEYLEYNRFDVKAERKIYLNLSPYDLPEHEWELWAIDQEINTRGIPINQSMVQNACRVRDEIVADRMEKMRQITGLENPNSGPQLLPWLQEQGYVFDDLKAGHVRRMIQRIDEDVTGGSAHPEEVKDLFEVLSLKAEIAKTSTKKFDALAKMTDDDGRLRNGHQFAGAGRTWRWAGRGFQVQNLARPAHGLDGIEWEELDSGLERVVGGTQINAARAVATMDAETLQLLYDNPMDVLSGAVRTVVQAPEGYVFIDADLKAIENVVLGWMSGDRRILGVFENNKDPYIDFATFLYKDSYEKLWHEYKVEKDKGKRTIAKPGVLGCLKGDTPVLTQSGWKAVVELTPKDWLYDGEKWVRHQGVVFKGHQSVLCGAGLHATPDHRFLTTEGWKEWQQVSQPQTLTSAIGMGNGVFLDFEVLPEAREKYSFARVNVVENESYQDQTSCEDYPEAVPVALQLTVAPSWGSESARICSTFSEIVSTLRDRVAKMKTTVPTVTTEAGEFAWSSLPCMSGSSILSMRSVQTGLWKSTESTTTVTTNEEISDSQLDRNKTQIADTWDILNTGDYARFAVLTENGCLVAHNCGYMLSAGHEYENHKTGEIEATGLLGYARNMYVNLTPEQSELSVSVWRETYKDAVQFWWDIQRAAMDCVKTGKPTVVRDIRFDRKGPFLRMILPSGRALHYVRPRLEQWLMPWGKYKLSLTYEQLNDKHQWDRVSTHPGKLTENADQAIARDLLAHGIRQAHNRGIKIVMHVHDQIVALVKEDEAEEKLRVLMECMGARPEWARSIPMAAAGHISKWFIKD